MPSFSENLLISLMGEKLLLEPEQIFEVRRGVQMAMETTEGEAARLERLAEALEQMGLPENQAVINLWAMPLEPLWIRAELRNVQKKLSGRDKAKIIIVGLWHNLVPTGKRTSASYRDFTYWQGFIEGQLMQTKWENLEIIWVG